VSAVRRRVDPAPTSEHIDALLDAGISVNDIAERSGISVTVVNRIRRGKHTCINRTTAQAIKAVRIPAHPDPRHRGHIDATAARDRLRHLTACGWTLIYLADQAASTPETLSRIRADRSPRLDVRLHQAIAHTHRLLAGADPVSHGIPAGAIAIAQLTAARNGWTAPRPDLKEIPMATDTQLELFPASAVAGTGRPQPWPIIRPLDTEPQPQQDETLFDGDTTAAGEAA
jgi:hypothetical protein